MNFRFFVHKIRLISFIAFLLSFNQIIEAHAGVGVEIRDGCDRYLAIGTWHSSVSEIQNTVRSTNKGLYIDLNLDGNFKNCCNGSNSTEFFTFTDYTFPKKAVRWNQITSGSSTVKDLLDFFNNSSVYNKSNIKDRFSAEVVWNPSCQNYLQSWLILKLPSSLKPGTIYKCRTSSTSVVEKPCSSAIFEIIFGTDIKITSNSKILCENDSILLKTSSANDLEWFRNDTLIKGPSSDSSLTIHKPGNYTVRKGGTGCKSRTSEKLEILKTPKIEMGFDTLICLGDSILLDGGEGISYLWSNGVKSRYVYNYGDSMHITRTDINGCVSIDSFSVNFHPQPKAYFSIDDSLQCFRDHKIVSTNKSTLDQGTFKKTLWTTDNTDYSNTDTITHTYSSPQDYTIHLSVESDKGCFDSISKDVTIFPMPKALFTADTSNLCERNNSFSIDYMGSISSGNFQKIWSFGDGVSSSTAEDTTKIYATHGSYPVRLELISDFNCRDTFEQTLMVHPQPKAYFSIDDSLQCFRDHKIVSTNKSTLDQGTFKKTLWTTDNTDYSNTDTITHTYSSPQDYTIHLSVESDKGCFDSISKDVTIFPMPKALFTADTSNLCERNNSFSIDYMGSISSGNFQKIWSFGDGVSSSTAEDTTKIFATHGSYPVRLELISDFNCRDTFEQTLMVHPQPKAYFSIDDSLQCFRDHKIVSTNKSTLDQGTFKKTLWTTDNTDYSNTDTITHTYSSPQDYTIHLSVESDKGCFDSISRDVTIFPMPKALFTADTSNLCERNNSFSIDYMGSISSGNFQKIWSFGDGVSSSTAEDTTKIYATHGSYPVRLELISDFNCRDTFEQTLVVHPQPKAYFSIDDSLQCFRDHKIVSTNKSTLDQGTFKKTLWTTDNTDYSNTDTITHTYSSPQDYTIHLSVESDKGCFDSISKDVTIFPMPKALFTADTVCLGDDISFNNLTEFDNGDLSYQWDFGDSQISTEKSPIHRYGVTDSFNVTLIVISKQNCSDTAQFNKVAIVHPVPTAGFYYIKNNSWQKETEYIFTDSSIDYDSLNWKINGFLESNDKEFRFTFNDTGLSNVILEAVNVFNCIDTASKVISVFPDLVYYIPNSFSPNNDGLNDKFKVVGLGFIDQYNMKIYDRWGELLFETNNMDEGWDGKFQGNIVQNGVYIYRVTFRDLGSKKRTFEKGNIHLIR